MTLYITPENKLHDDAEGFALTLPSWPQDARIATQEEIDAILNPPETPEQTLARLESSIDHYLDEQANLYRYESIRTMVTYAGDPNSQFNAEGVGALEFRSRCYTLALMIINEVNQGRPVPTESELIAEMPLLSDFIVYPA